MAKKSTDILKPRGPVLGLRPLFNRIMVKPFVPPPDIKTIGLIELPENHQMALPVSPYIRTDVLAVGPECKYAKVGDQILLNRGAIEGMLVEGNEYAIITEDRIYAIVERAPVAK